VSSATTRNARVAGSSPSFSRRPGGRGVAPAFEEFRKKHPLTLDNRKDDYLFIPAAAWDTWTWYSYHLIAVQLYPMILDAVIVAPQFLRFDPGINAFEETPFHAALMNLRFTRGDAVEVEPNKLAGLIRLYDRWTSPINLCVAIYRHPEGRPFVRGKKLRLRNEACCGLVDNH
jgi:hypothetical protein